MAEPAQQWDESDSVPGNQDSAPLSRPDLKALEGGGETSPSTGKLKSVSNTAENLSSKEQQVASPQPNQAGSYYKKSDNTKSHAGWRQILGSRRRKLMASVVVALASLIAAMVIFFSLLPFKILHVVNNLQQHFFSTSQAAVDKEVNVLESHYLKNYVLKGLNGSTCRSGQTIDKNCLPREVTGNSYLSRLYKSWRTNRLENKLATKYGLEFKKAGNNYYIKAPGMTGLGARLDDQFLSTNESLDDYIQRANDPQWRRVSRAELRAAVRDALDGETRYKKVLLRFKVGRLLEEKYAVRRCIVFCSARDNFDDWKGRKKDAAKAYLIDRVITPRSMALSIVMRCVLEGATTGKSSCSVDPLPTSTSCGTGDCALNGRREAGWERDLRADLFNYRNKLGQEAVEDLLKRVDAIGSKGYMTYLFENEGVGDEFRSESQSRQDNIQPDDSKGKSEAEKAAIRKQFADTFTEKLTKGGNIVGALDTSASMFAFLDDAGPMLHKLTYVTNAATYVQTYVMYRTYADEIKTGKVDATIVGSFSKTFSGSSGKITYQRYIRNVGGNASAEQAPLYQALIGGQSRSKIGKGTLATSAKKPVYVCNNQKPLDTSKSLVCDEENLQYNVSADKIQRVAEHEGVAQLVQISDGWVKARNSFFGPIIKAVNWTLEKLTSFIGAVLSILPGSDDIAHAIEKWYRDLMQWMMTFMIPSPLGENVSGARMFDAAAGGADVAGNDAAHYALGGKMLSDQTVSQIRQDQQNLELAKYQAQPLVARLFDSSNERSVVSRLALAMPSSGSEATRGLVSNPFGKIFGSFASLFNFGHAQAAKGIGPDPFGVSQYGYEPNDPIYKADPDTYWKDHCVMPGHDGDSQVSLDPSKDTYKWNDKATTGPPTYMPENHDTNGCLLIQAAVGSAGGLYDSSLLSEDDLTESASSSGSTPSSVADSQIDMANLYKDSTGIGCASGSRDIGIYDGYANGQLVKIRLCAIPNLSSTGEESRGLYGVKGANGQAIVNSRVSGAVLALASAAKADRLGLSAISTFRTMAHQQDLCPCDGVRVAIPGYSNHQMGLAIDFDGLPSSPGPVPGNRIWDWLSRNAGKFGYKNYVNEAWHWSPTGH